MVKDGLSGSNAKKTEPGGISHLEPLDSRTRTAKEKLNLGNSMVAISGLTDFREEVQSGAHRNHTYLESKRVYK